jgi:allantoin racemase
VRREIERAIAEDNCEAVILGCAGMADLTAWLSAETGVPVIDGVVAGVKMVEALIGAKITTSKIGAYALPREK